MNNLTKFSTLILIVLLIYSCDNESTAIPLDLNTEELISISEAFTLGDNPTSSTTTYAIDNNLNTRIDYEGGVYQLNTFTDGKVTFMEYFNNDIAYATETIEYDSNDRIVSKERIVPNQDEYITYEFEYDGNMILGTTFYYDDQGNLLDQDNYSFTLNSNNQIIRYENEANSVNWEATYIGSNLSAFSANGYGNDIDGSAVFSYSNNEASLPYQSDRYRYGMAWRNNVMIFQRGAYAFKQLAELGSNYLDNYEYTVTSNPTRKITLDVSYEFDALDRLIRQEKSKMFYEVLHYRELNYLYQ